MDMQDRKGIEDLFGKLANVEQQAAMPRPKPSFVIA